MESKEQIRNTKLCSVIKWPTVRLWQETTPLMKKFKKASTGILCCGMRAKMF